MRLKNPPNPEPRNGPKAALKTPLLLEYLSARPIVFKITAANLGEFIELCLGTHGCRTEPAGTRYLPALRRGLQSSPKTPLIQRWGERGGGR